MARRAGPARVLVVDDSPIARDLIARGLSLHAGIEVVGTAADAWQARDAIVSARPDVVTLDVELPRMDGIEFLRRLMPQYPIPVVIVSAVTAEGSSRALEALEAGAVEVVAKPRADDRQGLAAMLLDLAEKVAEAAAIDPRKLGAGRSSRSAGAAAGPTAGPKAGSRVRPGPSRRGGAAGARIGAGAADEERAGGEVLIGIGASTGGTVAIGRLLEAFPEDCPPTLVVQHMPPVFTRMFAQSLDRAVAPEVREAREGDRPRRGLVLVAPGDLQTRLRKDGAGYLLRCAAGEKVSGHRPSIDVLFSSMAEAAGPAAAAILMTGMGRDGAAGLLALRAAGARCIAQDEESSVVFGMPAEAWRIGAAERLVPLDGAGAELLGLAAAAAPRAP